LNDSAAVAAPMGRGDLHVYRLAADDYDSLEIT